MDRHNLGWMWNPFTKQLEKQILEDSNILTIALLSTPSGQTQRNVVSIQSYTDIAKQKILRDLDN